MTMRRKDRLPCGTFERRQFHNLSDVRREMVTLYWQVKAGKVDKGLAPSLVRLLDLIADYMVETEAERQARGLGQKIEELRQEMDARGIGLPPLIGVMPERVN
jgi:hypothetical protein